MAILSRRSGEAGFSLAEAVVALGLLAGGLLGVGAVLAAGVQKLADGPLDLVAKQKATEAIETVFTARDTRTATWAQLANVAAGGVFVNGAQPMKMAGPDGLINTADDGALEALILPGRDGILGNADDRLVPLTQFTRQIQITNVSATLRQITVTITFQTANGTRRYTLSTMISSFA
jgi:hypothetical protein